MNVSSPSPLKRALRIVVGGLLALGLLLVLSLGVLYLPPVQEVLGENVGALASAKTGLDIRVQRAAPGLSSLRLHGVTVQKGGQTLLSLETLVLRPELNALLEGRQVLSEVTGSGFALYVPADPRTLLASDAEPDVAESAPAGPPLEELSPQEKWLRRLAKGARLLDPAGFNLRLQRGRIVWHQAEAELVGEGPEAGAGEVALGLAHVLLSWQDPGKLPLSIGVGFREPAAAPIGLPVEHRDDAKPALEERLDVDLTFSEGATPLRVRFSGPGYGLDAFRPHLEKQLPPSLLEQLQPVLQRIPHWPALGGDFTVEVSPQGPRVAVEGRVELSQLYVDEPRLASVPFGPLRLSQTVKLDAQPTPLAIHLEKWEGKLGDAPYQLLARLDEQETALNLDVVLTLAQTPYQALLEAVPPKLVPALEGVKLGGTLDLKLTLNGDLRMPEGMNADYTADFSRLALETPSLPLRGPEPLKGFVYRPYNKDGVERELEVGRSAPGWVSIDQLPGHLVNSLLLSEDSAFFQHEGFDAKGLAFALKTNLKAGKPLRGGSTITQQLAKNLFLSRERTLVRKLQEAVLAYQLEKVLTKRQILEYYFNIIEWGPGFYGIGRAAQHYFGKHPSQLSIKEGAYLCTVIPNPLRYHGFFDRNELSVYWGNNLQALLNRLRAFERISEEEYQLASGAALYFRDQLSPAVDLSKLVVDPAAETPLEELEETDEEDSGEAPLFSLPQLRFVPLP